MRRELSEFLDYLRYERNASVHTISSYRRDLTQFGDFIRERGVSFRKVDNIQIRGFLAQLHERRLKKSSTARKLAAVRSFFQFGVKKKWIA
jgi:site-specific recombinase XerD